jgi:hypothetical protein
MRWSGGEIGTHELLQVGLLGLDGGGEEAGGGLARRPRHETLTPQVPCSRGTRGASRAAPSRSASPFPSSGRWNPNSTSGSGVSAATPASGASAAGTGSARGSSPAVGEEREGSAMRRAEAVDIGGLVIRAGKRRAVAEQIEIAWGVRTGKGPGGQRCMVAPGRRGFDPRLALPVNASNEGRVGKRACFKKKLLGEFGENGEHSGVVLSGGGKPEKVRATAHRKEGPLVRDV